MDIFSLSASFTLDTGDLESGLMKAQEGFAGISGAASSADNAVQSFSSGSVAAVSSLGSSFESAWADIKDAWSGAGAYFSGIASSISSAFSSLASSMAGIGQSMWSGLMSGFDSAMAGLSELAGSMVDTFKDELGIHSPSRVFAEIGRDMALGLDEGWSQTIGKIDLTSSLGTSSIDFASSSLGKSSSAQINTMLTGMQERGGNYNINLVVDGRTLANVVFDPLNAVSKQKGVALGA